MIVIPFYLGAALYLVAAALGAWYVGSGSPRAPGLSRGLASVGFAAHTLFLLAWGLRHGRVPVYAPFEVLAFLLWCAVLAYLVLDRAWRLRALPGFVLPLVALAAAALAVFVKPDPQVGTTARSGWLPVHAVTSLLGAADFLVAFAIAVMYLVQQRALKRKSVGPLMARMPSLDALDRLNYRAIALGMPVFTLALISGIVLAVEKGSDWWANWMVAGSFVAWMVYAILLHVRLATGLRGPKVAYLTILGFLLVAALFCGIAFLGDAVHTLHQHPASDVGGPKMERRDAP